jgi:hypothetical protein
MTAASNLGPHSIANNDGEEDPDPYRDDWTAGLIDSPSSSVRASRIIVPVVSRSPGGFRLVSATKLLEPQPPVPFLVEGVIRIASVALIAAYGGSGKTWAACDLAVAVGSGGKWLGRFATRQGLVSLLDYESGEREVARRLGALIKGRGIATPPALDACCMPDAYMDEPSFEDRIRELAAHRRLIVIDSLAAASPSSKENDATMRVGLDRLRRAAESTACTFVVLVHAKKTSGNAAEIDPREVLRGSSAIYDAADTVLVVTYSKGKPLRLMQAKARHGVSIEPLDVTIADRSGGGVILTASEHRAQAKASVFEELKTMLLVAANNVGPQSKNGLAAELKKGARTDRLKAIDELVAEGRLTCEAGLYWFQNHLPKTAGGR